MTASGLILYEGHSLIDGESIVCIATGLKQRSLNAKTGPMVQTWILRDDVSPEAAVATGEDRSICGDCKLRGVIQRLHNQEQVNRFRGCYVFVQQAPQAVWEAYKRGLHAPAATGDLAGQYVRGSSNAPAIQATRTNGGSDAPKSTAAC